MARRNGVKTVKLQLTIDETTDRIIDEMVGLGIHGPSKAEVASWIIRTWVWENQGNLRNNGISLINSEASDD